MIDPATLAFTVAVGDSTTERPWPFDAGVSSPAQLFLTVHGTTGVLTDAATGRTVTPAPTVTVDRTSHQFQVMVPRESWDPGRSTVRMWMGTGLWNAPRGVRRPGSARHRHDARWREPLGSRGDL